MPKDNMPYLILVVGDRDPKREFHEDYIPVPSELRIEEIIRNEKEASDKPRLKNYNLTLLDIHSLEIAKTELFDELQNLQNSYFAKTTENGESAKLSADGPGFMSQVQETNEFLNIRKNIPIYKLVRPEYKKEHKYKKSSLSEEDVNNYANKLANYMEETKAFTDAEITLKGLAKKLSISPHNLSQVINQKFNKNYYSIINQYRIEEAKKELANPENKNKSILEICLDAGFKSKSVFNSVFKKFTNMTPRQFRNNLYLPPNEDVPS